MPIKRGDVYMADLSPVIGCEQGGYRAVLVLQNDIGNLHSPTTIVAAMTTQEKKEMPTHVPAMVNGRKNTVLLEQVRTISRKRLSQYMCHLSEEDIAKVDKALKVSLYLESGQKDSSTPIHRKKKRWWWFRKKTHKT